MIWNAFLLAGWSAVLFAAGIGTALGAEPEKGAEDKAVRSLIAEMAEDWKKHDMKSYISRFTDDCDVVNRYGQRFKGRDKVTAQLTELHKSAFRDHLAERVPTVESVRFVTPDVAVVHERSKESEGESSYTYVVSKKEGGWKVESCTVVVIKAAAPPPKR